MTFQAFHGRMVLVCERCITTLEQREDPQAPEKTADKLWLKAKRDGWVERSGKHYCINCS